MEAILSNSTPKLSWFEITKMLIAVLTVLFITIFGTRSFPILRCEVNVCRGMFCSVL